MILIQLLAGEGILAQTVIYQNVPGNYTFQPPAGCTSFFVEMWGGGGAGSYNLSIGKGGGGSAYTKSLMVFPVNFFTSSHFDYTVGRGAFMPDYFNGNGENSSFTFQPGDPSTTLFSGFGYYGLAYAANDPSHTSTALFGKSEPGKGYNLDITYSGGAGGLNKICTFSTAYGGGGGGSAFAVSKGGDGGPAICNAAGAGGIGQGNGGKGLDWNKSGAQLGSNPGGGGGGNNGSVAEGGNGAVKITYYCNGTPGTIGYDGGTLPYPREGVSPYINNVSNPAGGIVQLISYTWQVSEDNGANWKIMAGENSSSLQVPDNDSVGWSYKRVTNSCGAKESNIIKLKMFSKNNISNGAPSKNGAITGYVRSRNGIGVAGITVLAQKDIPLKGSTQSYSYSVITDVNGKYQFSNIYYGDKDAPTSDPTPVNFTITPLKDNHKFDPLFYYPQPLSFDNYNVPDGPIFKDTTVLAVSGKVYQQCTGCLDGTNAVVNTIISGLDGARITGGDLPTFTEVDGTGYYSTTVQEPGLKSFTPSYKNHLFSPAFFSENIQDDVSGQDFTDITTRTISGKLTDGGGEIIGDALLEFTDTVTGRPGYTFRKQATTINGSYSINLPARSYRVKMISFSPNVANTSSPRTLNGNDVVDFFNSPETKDSLYRNIDTTNAVLNLVYHRRPVIQIVGLKDTICGGQSLGVIFKQNVRKPFTINVFEGDTAIGFKMVTLDKTNTADSLSIGDSIKIFTDLLDKTGISKPDTLINRLKAGKLDSSITAGVPNILPSFHRVFSVAYKDRYGREADTVDLITTTTGMQSPPQTFVTVAPDIPQLILHQPPGDQSYSYWEQGKTFTTTQKMSLGLEGSVARFAEVKAGADFSAGVGVEVSTKVEFSLSANINTTITSNSEDELTYANQVTTKYSTAPGAVGGDVFIGGAMNYKYGVSNVVDFDGCAIGLSEKLLIAPTGFQTTFNYSEDYILNTLIPTLKYFVVNAPDSKKAAYKNQLNVWNQVIDNNNNQKQNAKFLENRSFDGNSGALDISKTITKTATSTLSYNLVIDANVATTIGAEVNGIGASGSVTVGVKVDNGKSKSATQETTTTTGFVLDDDDPGDYYSVDIKEDKVYGTPVFALVAGTGSCPPEEGAQSRDNPRIIIDNPVQNNIPVTGKAFYTLKVANQSESRETRDYELRLDNTNANGITIKKDGVALGGTDIIPISTLGYLEVRNIDISVEKTNPAEKTLSYPNIEFVLSDACEGGVEYRNSITANFQSPCGGIALKGPVDGWVSASAGSNIIPITFDSYVQSGIDSVTLQYARQGSTNWFKGFTLAKTDIGQLSTTYPWDVTSLTDSLYKLRLRLVCGGGNITYSNLANGLIDRKAPYLVGNPKPGDKVYVSGDEISVTYNEAINTNSLGNSNVQITRLGNNTDIDVSIAGFENKVQIVPLVNLATYAGDSIRVIVKNIADVAGNMKIKPDTSYFIVDGAPAPQNFSFSNVPLDPVKTYAFKSSMLENGSDTLVVKFVLPNPAKQITKVNFTVAGTANYLTDYTIDTTTVFKTINDQNNVKQKYPVYNYFNGSEGYIYIDSLATTATLQFIPKKDSAPEDDETILINLSPGGDYNLNDSTNASVTIINDDVAITGDGPLTLCEGSSVTLSSLGSKTYNTYQWLPEGQTTPTLNVTTAGMYTLKVTDSYGNSFESAPANITVNAAATVSAGSALPGICPGVATVALNGGFGGSATGAIWTDGGAGGSFTNNTGSTPAITMYTPAFNANGTIKLTLTTVGGCIKTAVKDVFVNGQTSWLGVTNNWNLGSNWSNGVVPVSCTRVTIPPGVPFMPTLTGTDNACYKLMLQPGATVNIAAGAKILITGK